MSESENGRVIRGIMPVENYDTAGVYDQTLPLVVEGGLTIGKIVARKSLFTGAKAIPETRWLPDCDLAMVDVIIHHDNDRGRVSASIMFTRKLGEGEEKTIFGGMFHGDTEDEVMRKVRIQRGFVERL